MEMDFKFQREAPVFKRCCFCVPLRRGLIGWGYGRLILDILVIIYLVLLVIIISAFNKPRLACNVVLSFFIVDVGFTTLLVFAGHKKSSRLLRISYLYSIAWVILVFAFGVFGVTVEINRMYSRLQYYTSQRFPMYELGQLVINSAVLFTIIFVQVYVILLTHSEAIKLQNQSLEMQFVNNAAEAEARCVSVEQRCTDTDNGHAAEQYTDNGYDGSVQHEPVQNGNKSDIV